MKERHVRRPRFATAVLLSLIILLALGLRFACYTGPIGSDDHDYYLAAHEMYQGIYHPSNNYWKNRFGMILPIFAFYEAFGTNEFAAAGWPMLCSAGAVMVCYFLGKSLLDARTGLLAALLLAFYPLDIHYSGLILPDIPLSFLMAASVLAFITGCQSEKYGPVLFFVSGLLLAVAYSCRSMAVILLPFLLLYAAVFEKKMKPSYLLFVLGFLAVTAAEGLYYAANGLSPLHNIRLNARAAIAVNTAGECSTSLAYYPIVIFRNVNVFGAYFFLFVSAMVVAGIKRERGPLILLAWAGSILLILQFGVVGIHPLIPIVKVRKFLNFATVPLILLGAWTLMKLRGRYRWTVVAFLAASSLYFLRPYVYSANGTPEASGSNIRNVVAYLETMPPKPIYADLRTQAMMMITSRFELTSDRFRNLYEIGSPEELKDCYVVINRFYAHFDRTNPYAKVPYFVANYPAGIPPRWRAKDFVQSAVLDVP
ncbi:MAG: phospholipid carrier-dependent glycosyltransferase [Candidatus Abyssobacteria bacterium SURF_17]|uniref:Phospholipid carrier-dependent glycosyltransferase n=1 Tax=Candidatus Abyssobacteria bacterium SURF_17 TaxID=2093361 RepID=A0A419ENR8_9BACT|nr:MAG: phospholipid carrier-dependent glycosyltransferase [Candidatus Abyssubacteria bacterium SURF_17]